MDLLRKIAAWFSRKIAWFAFPYIKKTMTGRDYYEAVKYAKPGMVFLTRANGYLSNSFIPGFWKHAAIYCNHDGNSPCVVEATNEGVVKTDLISFMMSKDVAALFKPIFASSAMMRQASDISHNLLGKPYDFEFSSSEEAFYCSEIIWHVYNKATNGRMPFELRETLGEPTAIPQDIANATKKWDKIWHSSSYLGESK